MDLTLEPYGDRELHAVKIKLEDGEGCIPVFVQLYRADKQEFARIAPAIGLYAEQATRLEYHFSIYNEWKRRDIFLIKRKHLCNLTERVNGITPSYYYRWPGKDVPLPTGDKLKVNGEEIQPIPDDAEDFFEYVHKRRAIDRNVLRLAWSALSKEAVGWMLKKKKPINLGFVTLHAVPYRANWKEILLARFPNGNAPWWFKQYTNNGKFTNTMAEAEFKSELASVEMIAIHGRDHYITWSMEAVPSLSWEEDVREYEMLKRSSGNTNYVRGYEKLVEDLFPRITSVFLAWIKKITIPFAKIQSGNHDGSIKMVPYRGRQDVCPQIGKSISVRVVLQDGPAKIGQRALGESVTVRPKINSVPSLPGVLQAANDVRECEIDRDVAGFENGQAKPNGVPVLPSGQTEAIECELLAVRTEPEPEPVAKGD